MTHRRGAKHRRSNDSSALAASLADEYRSTGGKSLREWFDGVESWITAEGAPRTKTLEILDLAEVDPRSVITDWMNNERT